MANRRNEGDMPAEQGSHRRDIVDDPVGDDRNDEKVRGVGDHDDEFEDTDDAEDMEETEEDENEEGSF